MSGVLLFGAVEGGYSLEQRIRSAKSTASRNVDGFLLDGFHLNGPESAGVDLSLVAPLICQAVAHLPASKPRMYQGSCDPLQVIALVQCGVDMFDSSYAHHLTKEGRAIRLENWMCLETDLDADTDEHELVRGLWSIANIPCLSHGIQISNCEEGVPETDRIEY
jgi:tRNA-guanine family transglycosylase